MKTFYRELLKQGKTIKWLADKLGVSHQTVYLWKLGKSNPTPGNLVKIAQFLKLDPNVLIDEHYKK